MNSYERVTRTLEFNEPDAIPKDLWVLPAARMKYGEDLTKLLDKYEQDIVSIAGPFDHGFTQQYYLPGTFKDPWGSIWTNIQAGMIGEVKEPVFADENDIADYAPPVELFNVQWDENQDSILYQINKAREGGKFIIGGWVSLFERLQYLRGTEALYCDIALEEDHLSKMIQYVMEFERVYIDSWLQLDIDAVAFGDDWGTQISMLISPDVWRRIFKPLYSELIGMIKAKGKKVFFHSDGYILDLYPEFIDMGVDAVNSQLWCMGIENVAQKYAGKITFWGEISRQTTLPKGTPDDIQQCANVLKQHLFKNGGLIGQSEINRDVPLENIIALLNAWD